MQGFIIKIVRVRDEDLLVTILSQERVETLYRFYGARHAAVGMGYKIDFERELSGKTTIPRLRDVLHLGYEWLYDRDKLGVWQHFIRLFAPHLQDVEHLDPFYFDLLEQSAAHWTKRDPKRLAVESYLKLLEFEGRLHTPQRCFLCDAPLGERTALARAFLPAHPECLGREGFETPKVTALAADKRTLLFDDREIQRLWEILGQGL